MNEQVKLELVPVEELQLLKGVPFPEGIKFRQLIVTGPPGCGKTRMMNEVGGWPEEGYIDLTLNNWWRAQSLTLRPREINFGFPFEGHDEALTVFDKEWLEAPSPPTLDFSRIVLPSRKAHFLAVNWRQRFVFEFLIPSADKILEWRLERFRKETHPIDEGVTRQEVENQASVYFEAALHFHRSGMLTYVRDEYNGVPKAFVEPSQGRSRGVDSSHWGEQDGLLEKILGYVTKGNKNAVLALGSQPYRVTRPVRVEFDGRPIELLLGKRMLQLRPEIGVAPEQSSGGKDWVLLDPKRFYTEISGFKRLKLGEKILVGRANDSLDTMFNFPKSVGKRHLTLENEGGQILVSPLDKESETYISCVESNGEIERLKSQHLNNLRQLREIFGGPIELLPPEEALATIEQALEIVRHESYRQEDSRGRPGGVLEIPDEPTPVVVGDLHAETDNLLKVLSVGQLLEGMTSGDVMLLLLGDTVHSETDDNLDEMATSLLMLDLIFKLKIRFPTRLFYLRGNHESLDESVGKSGVPQGLLLKQQALSLRGEEYVKRLAEWFDVLPYVAKTNDFIATHAGPPRSSGTLQELIDICDHPQLAWQLRWNRLQRPTQPAGYTKKDVKAFRERLGVGKRTPLIVSHNPLSRDATSWMNAGEIKNHHIVFSANRDGVGVIIRADGEMVPVEYRAEPITEHANRLDITGQ